MGRMSWTIRKVSKMPMIKWLFMSKYKRLLYQIKIAKSNRQRLYLPNGIILDFTKEQEEQDD